MTITSLAERLEQKGYNRALELVKRAEAEKQSLRDCNYGGN